MSILQIKIEVCVINYIRRKKYNSKKIPTNANTSLWHDWRSHLRTQNRL